MANTEQNRAIDQDLAQIKNAIYGEEVRDAIIDGIEQCYSDANDVVKVSETQPTEENVKLWVKPESQELVVPTYEDLQTFEAGVTEDIQAFKEDVNEKTAIVETYDDELNGLKSALTKSNLLKEVTEWTDGHYISASGGTPELNGFSVSNFIDIEGFSIVHISTWLQQNMYVACYDATQAKIRGIGGTTAGTTLHEFDLDVHDAKYVRITCATGKKTQYSIVCDALQDVGYIQEEIDSVKNAVDVLNNGYFSLDIGNDFTQGYLTSGGTIASMSGFYVTDFIDVSGFLSAVIHTYLSANMHVCGYDENKTFKRDYGAPSSGGNQNFDVTADLTGVKYVRITVANNHQSEVYVRGELIGSLLEANDAIAEIKGKIEYSLELKASDLHYYITSTSGNRSYFESYNVYGSESYLEINDFKNYKIVFENAPREFSTAGIAFYDISRHYISGIQYDGVTKEFSIPAKARYFRFTYFSTVPGTVKLVVDNFVSLSFPKTITPEKYIENLYASFLKVGIIGDSLASGEAYSNNGGVSAPHDLYEYSWGQFMARRSGNTYYNFSSGGQTTRSWLLPRAQGGWYDVATDGEHDCMAYYIALGQNDHSYQGMGMDYLGVPADMDDETKDTFYGNYGKIIRAMKTVEPKAVFFLVNMPVMSQASEPAYEAKIAYNEAIGNIAAHFDGCYLLDLNRYSTLIASGNDYLRAQSRNAHFNAVAYNYFASVIIELTNEAMVLNREGFMQVEFIGTEWSWA